MKLKIFSIEGTETGTVDLPEVFLGTVRQDVIKRAVDTIHANNRQPYSAKEHAGMRSSAELSRRRHNYRGSYGFGISRVPRKIMSRRGTRLNWVAAFAPGTVGGRRAHPPKAEKIFTRKINAKENRLAIRSALAATLSKELVMKNGHNVPENYPFIVDNAIEDISKTKEARLILKKIGFDSEMGRTNKKKIRAGKGKSRGRKYKTKKGLLIVTAEKSKFSKAVLNVLGFQTVTVANLNALLLAPSGIGGRAVLFTQSAIEKIKQEKLFTEDRIKIKNEKKVVKEEKENSKKTINKITKEKPVKEKPKVAVKKQEKNLPKEVPKTQTK